MNVPSRKLIFAFILLGALTALAVGLVSAQEPNPSLQHIEEIIYISDTGEVGDGQSGLYQVHIDQVEGRANLELLPGGQLNYDHVDTLAATPDGARIYFIDDGPQFTGPAATLGYYDVAAETVHEVGVVTLNGDNLFSFDQGAFSPDGTFYATTSTSDSLFTLDPTTAEATMVGEVVDQATGNTLNVAGADIAFTDDGDLYFFTNPINGPRGLYLLELPAQNGVVNAAFIGPGSDPHAIRGIAIRANGQGDIAASTEEDEIHILDKETSEDAIPPLLMYLDGAVFDAEAGDMTNGPLFLCTFGYGYWRSHGWGDKQAIVLGVVVDEALGHEIMSSIGGNDNFSLLFTELIAAKLNANNASGIPVIDNAEEWMAAQPGLINPDGTLNYTKTFDSFLQRMIARRHSRMLDEFNNQLMCCHPDEVPPGVSTVDVIVPGAALKGYTR